MPGKNIFYPFDDHESSAEAGKPQWGIAVYIRRIGRTDTGVLGSVLGACGELMCIINRILLCPDMKIRRQHYKVHIKFMLQHLWCVAAP